MTPPDDHESKPESSPPGAKYLSPRLRAKLESGGGGDDDLDFLNKKPSPVGLIITIVLVVVAIGGIGVLVRNSREKAKAEAAEAARVAAAERAKVVADSLATIAQQDSVRAVAVADSIAFTKLPKWKQRQILAAKAAAAGGAAAQPAAAATTPAAAGASTGGTSAPATPSEPPPPVEKGPFGIDAAQFLEEAKANQVAEELKTKTGLAAVVVNMNDTYHVVLGKFSSHASADAKSNALLGKGLIEQGGVVPLPGEK